MTPSRRLASPLLAALLVAACAGGQASPVASAAPSLVAPSELASPTPDPVTPRPTAAPTPEGAQVPPTVGTRGRALDPGLYAMPPWFRIPLSLELGDGWAGVRDDRARQVNLIRGSNEVGHGTHWLGIYAIASDDDEGFVAELHATPFLTLEEAVPVELARVAAEQIDAQAASNPEEPGGGSQVPATIDIHAMRLLHSPGITDFTWYTESPEARLRFLTAEVGDDTLVLNVEAPPDEFDAYVDTLVASVLGSILFYPRS